MIVLGLRQVSAMRKKWHLCQCLCIHFILPFCARTKNSSENCSNRPPLTESSQYIYLKNLRPRQRRLSFTAIFIEVCFSWRGLGCVACAVRELQYCSALAHSTVRYFLSLAGMSGGDCQSTLQQPPLHERNKQRVIIAPY